MVWGPMIAWYLFLAGASAGAFLTSTFVEAKYPESVKMRVAGRIIAPIFVGIGLLMLMLDAEARSAQPAALLLAHLEPRFRDDAGRVLHLRVHAGGACRGRSRDTQEARAEVAHVDRHRRGVRRGGLHRLLLAWSRRTAVEQRHIAHPVRGVALSAASLPRRSWGGLIVDRERFEQMC